MDLDALRLFTKVAELASFTRAAEQLHLPKSRVSAVVRQLEASLGTRLLHRTTRTVRLTSDGETFCLRATDLLAQAEELQAMFQQAGSPLSGRLRIDLPTAMARTLVLPRLPEFLSANPGLTVEISTTDRRVDVVHEGFDCVLRIGTLGDSGLVARRLGLLPLDNLASPAYLQAHGTPQTLDDLDHHRVVHYSPNLGDAAAAWEYQLPGDTAVHFKRMQASVTVNGADAYQAACLAGLGFVQMPRLRSWELIASGQLVRVLPEYSAAPMPVSLLHAHRRQVPRRVSVFMEWLDGVVRPHLEGA
ncbi:MAG: hypothetical protein RLZZ618_3905 [Pseudomonadota bacterium]|jgi:DNA-binding transcriptional LysR family regulator